MMRWIGGEGEGEEVVPRMTPSCVTGECSIQDGGHQDRVGLRPRLKENRNLLAFPGSGLEKATISTDSNSVQFSEVPSYAVQLYSPYKTTTK